MIKIAIWVLFFASTVVAGSSSGVWTIDGGWYQSLNSPSFQPPSWVFGPVWTTIYILIATAGYRISQNIKGEKLGLLSALWALQMVLNTIWTPVFFGAHNLGIALVYILVLWVTILGLITIAWKADRITAFLMTPYLAWVSFATLLNYAFWQLNPSV